MLNISAVERDTGLSKDTLRIWERRYGFPQPQRDAFGERVYPAEQVQRLRLMRRLLDAGYRPGKLVALPLAELQVLACGDSSALAAGAARSAGEGVGRLLALAIAGRLDELRAALMQAERHQGAARFVIDVAAPLIQAAAVARSRGALAPFAEQMFGESLHVVLRHAIFGMSTAWSGVSACASHLPAPHLLLTTLPGECQSLGLLLIEALATERGAPCTSLGIQTPIPDIVSAADAQRADVVLLSFAGNLSPRQTVDELAALRAALPASAALWACGVCPALHKRRLGGVRLLASMGALDEVLAGRLLAQREGHL